MKRGKKRRHNPASLTHLSHTQQSSHSNNFFCLVTAPLIACVCLCLHGHVLACTRLHAQTRMRLHGHATMLDPTSLAWTLRLHEAEVCGGEQQESSFFGLLACLIHSHSHTHPATVCCAHTLHMQEPASAEQQMRQLVCVVLFAFSLLARSALSKPTHPALPWITGSLPASHSRAAGTQQRAAGPGARAACSNGG